MKNIYLRLVLLGFLLWPVSAFAEDQQPFKMSFPVDCTYNEDCWLLYYVDVNRTKNEVEDFACGKRSYDQHKGTDFTIRDTAAMEKGIGVLAVAPGTVLRLRDGVPDRFQTKQELEAVKEAGIECGNGIYIDHGNGYATQYCHLKKGSLLVEKGQKVERGEKLGDVGISGLAEHPHLHLTVYKDNKLIDPFMGLGVNEDCHKDHHDQKVYWDESMPAREDMPAFYDSGFSTAVPKFDRIAQGDRGEIPTIGAKAFVFWVAMFDIRQGDYFVIKLSDDQGREISKQTFSQEKDKIRQYYAVGRKIRQGLPAGRYVGSVALTRVMDDGNTQTYRHSQDITIE